MKKAVDRRDRVQRLLKGSLLRGRPQGRRTGTKPGKRSIPQAWRDLDKECLEFALNELNDESLDEQFVNCAALRARFHELQGDYKIRKLSGNPTGSRRPRAHEQRVRRLAKDVLKEEARERLSFFKP